MKQMPETLIRVLADPTNPGQFFACCGLLELADRFWGEAEGWFENCAFNIRPTTESGIEPSLAVLLRAVAQTSLHQVDPTDDLSSPIEIAAPFDLRLDWWKDKRTGGDRLKVWAGSNSNVRIARAMQRVLQQEDLQND